MRRAARRDGNEAELVKMAKAICTCGKEFTPHRRPAKNGGSRIQKYCSIECHIARRNYFGEKNPNWRDANRHKCAECGWEFVGKRPNSNVEKYCSWRCYAYSAKNWIMRNRRDANEPELLEAAQKMGAQWIQEGPLDGWSWHWKTGFMPVEIKRPQMKGRSKEFTKAQKRFFAMCDAAGAKYWIWRTVEDVVKCLNGTEN